MAKCIWDPIGEHFFEAGVEKAVIYPQVNGAYPKGEAWGGVTAMNESPSGAEPQAFYADNRKYLNILSAEEFGLTIEAYMYPDSFAKCNGEEEIATGVRITQQKRSPFGLSYVSKIGNDTDGVDYSEKIHLVYGCLAAPSESAHNTIGESVEPETMSWDVSTTPVDVEGFKPTAHIEIDCSKCNANELATLKDIIWGTTDKDPRLPLPDELRTIFATSAIAIG